MNRQQIAKNVNLTILPNDKFKRNRLSVNFIVPNTKDMATKFAILPSLLERAYEDYPNMQLLSRKLSRMYSASLSATSSVIGQNRSLRFTIQGIKNEYCLSDENLLEEMSRLLMGIIFKPCTEDGAFIASWTEVEKEKLKEEIEGEINDKRSYCIKNAKRKFFKDSLNGVEKLGYIQEIDDITPQKLFECYKYVINTGVVEIFITANETQEIFQLFKKYFKEDNRIDSAILPISVTAPCETEKYIEKIDMTQGKICLLYTTKRPLEEDERYKMLVATALLGGTASSRLFKNVREKQSLCYYCAAGFNGFTSSMSVDSGVEHENVEKTISAIEHELAQLISGDITAKEIEETKLVIQNSLKANYDGLHGLEAWYLNEAMRTTSCTPEYAMKKVCTVTEQDIKDVLKLFNLNVIYILTK